MLIYMFNSAAQKLFGFAHPSEKGMKLQELPLDNAGRQAMLRRHRSVIQTRKQSTIRNCRLVTNRFDGIVDVHFTPLSTETGSGVIVMFQVERQNPNSKRPAAMKIAKKNGKPDAPAEKKKSAGKEEVRKKR